MFLQDGLGTSCSFNYYGEDLFTRMFVLTMFLGGFCVPLLVIIVCYSIIFCTVHKHEHMLQVQTLRNNPTFRGKHKNFKSEMKVARVSLIAVSLYCLAWVPYAVVSLIGVSGHTSLITPLVSVLPAVFAKVSVIYNPLVYAICTKRFKLFITASFCRLPLRAQTIEMETSQQMVTPSSCSSFQENTYYKERSKLKYVPIKQGQGSFTTQTSKF